MSISAYHQTRLESWKQIRAASLGAGVSLLNRAGEYVASFDCAERASLVLGQRNLTKSDCVPTLTIPTEEMQSALAKLAQRFSVALVDLVAEKDRLRFVCVWRIDGQESGQPERGKLESPLPTDPADEY